jgi:hypothetical protein
MAVSSIRRPAPSANPQLGTIADAIAFDVGAWLTRFSDAGGWWIVGADNRISIGWTPQARNPIENAAARALWRQIEANAGKRWALEQALIDGAEGLPQGLPTRYTGMSLYLAATDQRAPAPEELMKPRADGGDAWELARNAFDQADLREAQLRETVFAPVDALGLPPGDPIGDHVEHLMNAANTITDAARCAALRAPSPNGAALRWKLEQLLIEDAPLPTGSRQELDQLFADLDNLLGEK